VNRDIVFITGDLEQIEERTRQLFNRTLAPLESTIDVIAVKIDHDKTLSSASFDFRCTILLKIKGGATLRAEGCDCDDILAVYRALAKIVDQIPLENVEVGNAKSSSLPGSILTEQRYR